MNEAGFRKRTAPWPGVAHDVTWQDDLAASVAGKMFAVYGLRGRDCGRFSFKVPDDPFLALTDQPGLAPAPSAARYHRVSTIEPQRHGAAWLSRMIRQPYELVAARLPKQTRRKLGLLR
ncbi:MAG TPA: MmcQ/YjbR family DNA-binding protein [Solimonas sp.]